MGETNTEVDIVRDTLFVRDTLGLNEVEMDGVAVAVWEVDKHRVGVIVRVLVGETEEVGETEGEEDTEGLLEKLGDPLGQGVPLRLTLPLEVCEAHFVMLKETVRLGLPETEAVGLRLRVSVTLAVLLEE